MSAAAAWALAAALWLGCLAPGPWWLSPAGVVTLGVASHLADDRRRLALALAGLALAGAGLAGGRVALAEQAVLAAWAERGGSATVEAVVVSEARETAGGAWQLVRVRALDGRRVRERAALALDHAGDAADVGARVRLRATARPLARDGFDGHLRRLHAVVLLAPRSGLETRAPPGPLWSATTRVRERLRAAAARGLDPDRAVVLTGLVTGDVRGQDPAQRQALRDAGLTHLVVVSGRHVGIFLAGVLGLGALTGLGARGRRRLALGALGWFVLVTRWQPSVLRAGTMAGLALAAGISGRRADPRHALAMAVVLLLLVDPLLAGHLGFALSATATAGVLVVAPWLARQLRGPRPLRLGVAACVGAQTGAAPVLLQLDGGLALASVPANLAAVPAAALAQSVGLVAALVAQVSVAAGGAVATLAGPPLSVVLWAAGTFAGGPRIDAALLATPVAAALAGLVLVRLLAPRLAIPAVAVTLAVVVPLAAPAGLPPRAGSAGPVETLTVTMLDVGQGDAVLVEVPGGGGSAGPARMLVDGGPEPDVAWAWLRAAGVRRLDAVALSHPHDDHSGGLPEVLARAQVGAFLVGPHPLDERSTASAQAAYAQARERGVPVLALRAGQRFALGAAEVEVLSPPADGLLDENLNERSLVLRVATVAGAVLLTGDAEVVAQTRLLDRPDRLVAAVLKVPHHGGATNAPGFLEAVGAEVALIGVGKDNDYAHPSGTTLGELAAAGAHVYRTDEHGTVTVRLRAGGAEVEAERRTGARAPPCAAASCLARASVLQ